MDETRIEELRHKLTQYRQMVDLYPTEPKYLQRLAEILLQLGEESEAADRMRTLEKLYEKQGKAAAALSLKNLRESICSNEAETDAALSPFATVIQPEALRQLMSGGKRLYLAEGEALIRQGNTDDDMYLVLDGELAVLVSYRKNKMPSLVHILKEGDIVGEMAFLEGGARSSDVVANSRATVMKLSHKRVLRCLLNFPEVGDALRRENELRQRLTAINSNTLLAMLPDDAKATLARHAETMHYPAFAVVSRSKKKLPWMGIMVSGLIRIVAEDRFGNSHLLDPVKPGDTIGDTAALREESLPADMITVNESVILQIPAETFRDVMAANPIIRNRLIEYAANRLAGTMVHISQKAG